LVTINGPSYRLKGRLEELRSGLEDGREGRNDPDR
jgi:hypothetical protein